MKIRPLNEPPKVAGLALPDLTVGKVYSIYPPSYANQLHKCNLRLVCKDTYHVLAVLNLGSNKILPAHYSKNFLYYPLNAELLVSRLAALR